MDYGSEVQQRKCRPGDKGILCAGSTVHSTDAGKMRYVAHKTRLRVLSREAISALEGLSFDHTSQSTSWILHCLGHYCKCSAEDINAIVCQHALGNLYDTTIHISEKLKILNISLSSGVLVRVTSKGAIDTCGIERCIETGTELPFPDDMENLFSTYFLTVPYIIHDMPPRTLLSHVHSTQAVCVPFTMTSSRVTPWHASNPLVRTSVTRDIVSEQTTSVSSVFSLPGEDICICYANFNYNYEDCIMINKSSADKGLFAYTAVSSHLVSPRETIPAVGVVINTSDYRWWKADVPGTVLSVTKNVGGDISITMSRSCELVTGDKLATQHGQKGVAYLMAAEDMPWGIDNKGNDVMFDAVMAVSSLTNRVTMGQYYETQQSMRIPYEIGFTHISTKELDTREKCTANVTSAQMTCLGLKWAKNRLRQSDGL